MIPFGILICLYAIGSAVLPLLGLQLRLMLWMEQLTQPAQWAIRVVLLGVGLASIGAGLRARARRRAASAGDEGPAGVGSESDAGAKEA